ncbi:MAG: glycosyltransferase family 4 protein [Bacteroidales bacterium]
MKILQIAHKPPWPPVDGASIAMYNLCRGLVSNGHQVHVLAMNTYKQYCDISKVPEDFRTNARYTLVDIDIRIRAIPALLNLFSGKSYNMVRFDTSEVRKTLDEILSRTEYDLVILESLFSTAYLDLLRKRFPGPVILRSHNVEFNIWENLTNNERNPLKKWYLKLLTHRLKRYELETLSKVDFISSISEPDMDAFRKSGCTTAMEYVPFGINFNDEVYKSWSPPEKEEFVFFHVGSMDWLPHQEAFRWFLSEVWVPFSKQHPEAVLHLAGSKMPGWIAEGNFPNVITQKGYVNGHEFMKKKAIMVVPSFSGSGIRIKIAEGMAMGKVIITTSNGAMGIPATNNENIFICDDRAAWIETLGKCMDNPELTKAISRNARQFAEREFNYLASAKKLVEEVFQAAGEIINK